MKRIIVCADDYGMSPHVDNAILDLIKNERISATSCMTQALDWKSSARSLQPLIKKVAVGLHFDLSHHISLKKLITRSIFNKHDIQSIIDTLKCQLDSFEDQMNCHPKYIDGHQHIHMFPKIREAVLKEIYFRYSNDTLWIRNPVVSIYGHDSPLKAIAMKFLNYGFLTQIKNHGFNTNHSFSGLYSFDDNADFAKLMENWIDKASHGSLIMCHPATIGSKDEHYKARINEFQYLMSERYLNYLSFNRINLTGSVS
ncbi:ChbG/HpnK family deacetylase [Vibrio harveyi]|uniref:ChbG/HpnK family deacetylase n=1 Tax=Vibrio harveyi TaxID=669 RepID=UPI0010FFC106|nr:ChbG/HpnK family deacetylase [Vibrio harveyi]GEA21806.1 cellobiose phosphorylase [Vibrio harveyi]HDM8072054.1 ChbG/HpnK family deacetylase [Vibrio harveyi]